MSAKRVVIVGGGFAGVESARALKKALPSGWEISLNETVVVPISRREPSSDSVKSV